MAMSNSLNRRLPSIPGYTLTEPIYVGSRTAVYRALAGEGKQAKPLVIKILRSPSPSINELVRFRNQYIIAKKLACPGIVTPLALVFWNHSYALVMEDVSGIALWEYMRTYDRLTIEQVMAIALQMADNLHHLSQHQVLHKDINPANILIDPETDQIWLTDFSLASLLPKECQELQSPHVLEGNLAYIAPEQTGRMNRSIDYRADFYSLGVVLYELLTGELPFQSDDPMDLVHCHLAKVPVPPCEIDKRRQTADGKQNSPSPHPPPIPKPLSDIVLKLMAKNAEDRYQSALGLKHDLQQCLNQWEASRRIESFELGQEDRCDRFLIPEKLYGRDAAVQMLLDAFERVSQGRSELMLVTGFSGIGKTAVVNEVHRPITRQKGYFIKGKFDQLNRTVPFSAFVQAFRSLMGQLLGESDAALADWKTKILAAVGETGQMLIEVIPELEQIIGPQPAVPDLSGTAAQNRFNLLFSKFIQVFATPDHPLVIFLDDLQWIDSASLNLLTLLMDKAHTGCLLMLGAYRNNEVTASHPLMLSLAELKNSPAVSTLTLGAIEFDCINQLVAETLNCSQDYAYSLAQLIHQKTNGNPFFIRQLLQGLYEEGLITFNTNLRYWESNLEEIYQSVISDDVVEFITSRLHQLSRDIQDILKLGACIGYRFDLETLSIICQKPQQTITKYLWDALQEGILLPIDNAYKFFQDDIRVIDLKTTTVQYRFLHDRVQQAAYRLIPENQRTQVHYTIGQLLIQRISQDTEEDRIFELVSHLNYGVEFITSQSSRENIAQLNLKAAQKARKSTAYQAGLEYVRVGISLLGDTAWQCQYETSLQLYELAAELAFLCGDFNSSQQYSETIIQQTRSLLDQINIYCLKIQIDVAQTNLAEAITTTQQLLQRLGIFLPESPTQEGTWQLVLEIEQLISDREISQLSCLPMMTDETVIAIIRVISSVIPAAYISGSPFFPLWVALATKLSIQFGNIPASAFIYINYSYILCHYFQAVDTGDAFGQLALQLVDDLDAKSVKPHVFIMSGLYTLHRKSYIRETLPLLRQGYGAALEVGNYEWVGYGAYSFCANAFACSQNLAVLAQEIQTYCNGVTQLNQITSANWCQIYWQSALNLMGQSKNPATLSGELFQEEDFFAGITANQDFLGLFYFHLYKIILCYLFGDNSSARTHAVDARNYLIVGGGTVGMPIFYYYDALSALKELVTLEPDSQDYRDLLQQVNENQKQLQHDWANHAPMNYQHKVDLIAAEKSHLMGQRAEAIDQYDQAISSAKENQYCLEEALANELTAKFYLDWGKQKIAAVYMQDAYCCYDRWGAKAKTDDLEQRYSQLLQPILDQRRGSDPLEALASVANPNLPGHALSSSLFSDISSNTHLDFSTVLKSAQLLSEKIQLDELLAQLVKLMLQNSGADRLAIVFPGDDGSWQVRAKATPETTKLLAEPLTEYSNLPIQLIQYVKNTQDIVVIDNLDTELPIIDAYLQQQQPKSVLCLPLLHQGNLTGLLYLQNQSIAGVFSRDRITILNLLSTQAAISLEHAQLYEQSQTNAQQLEHSLSQLQVHETRFRNMAANIPGIIYQLRIAPDGVTSVLYVSPDCDTLYGVTAEAIMAGQYRFRDFVHQEDRPTIEQSVAESAQLLQPFDQTFRIVTHSGELKWIQAISRPSQQLDGAIIWDGVLMDVSDRKATEQALVLKQNHLEALLNNIPHIAWVKDSEGRFIAVNKALAQLLNCNPADMLGKTDYDFSPIEIACGYQDDDFHVLTSGQRKVVEERVRRGDGSWRWLETTKTPFRDAQGRLAGTVGIAADITDRKQAEQLLTDYNHELEQQVEERTQALQKSELALQTLVAGTAATTGEDFFSALVHHISAALDVPIALVTQFVDQELQSLAFIVDGKLQPNFTYNLPDTPCRDLLVDYSYHCPSDLSKHFPNHPHRARGVDSYLGVALRNRQGQVLGSLCIFDRQPLQELERARQILNVFGSRAATELERQRTEKALENLIAGTAITTRSNFFPVLVRYLTEALGVSHALMAERVGNEEIVLAYFGDGQLLPVQSFSFLNTPCEEVYERGVYYCNLEPGQTTCAELNKMKSRSYLGIALNDRQGNVIGLLSIFHRKVLPDPIRAEQIMRVFAARAATELERQRTENALQNLIEGTAALTGPAFFPALVQHIATALGASHAFVTEVVEDGSRLHFLAAWADGHHLPNDTVNAEGTTCLLALEQGTYYCERDVITRFPENPRLAPMGVESYMGVALKNQVGQAIGTLCIFLRQPIADPEHATQILQVFAARASAELERQRAKQAMEQLNCELERRVRDRTAQLTASEERLQTLFNQAADAVFLMSEQGFIDCNQAAVDLLQYPSKTELLALQPHQISPERQPDGQLSAVKAQCLTQEALQRCSLRFEWVHQRADKALFWAEITLTPIRYQEEIIFHCMARDISDRKQLEQEQFQLIAVLEATPDFIGIANAQGEILWQNKPLREIRQDLGNPEDHRLIENCYPDWVNKIIRDEALPTAIQQGSWSGELALLDREGTEIPVSQVIIAHKSTSGEMENFSTIMRDIRTIKRTEAALKLSKARAQATFTQAAVGFVEVDIKTKKCVRVNNCFCDMLGYTGAELAEMAVKEITHPEDIPASVEAMRQLHKGEIDNFNLEKRYIRKDGSTFWAETTCYMIQPHGGEAIYSVALIQDISEKKQLEAERQRTAGALQLSEARANAAFEQAAVGIAESNMTDGKITRTNNYFCQMTGYTTQELESLTATDLTHPEDLSDSQHKVKELYTGKIDSFTIEKRYLRKDGSSFWATTAVTLIQNPAEDSPRCLAVIQDISDRKQADTQLRQTLTQLEASNNELESFAYSISHDLRAPLRAINGFSQALLEDYGHLFNEAGQDYFARILANTNRMSQLIDDLLQLSRLSRSELRYTTVNLSSIAQEVLRDLQVSEPDERQVEIIVQSGATVVADTALMQVVMMNLLQNAWKFTSHHPTARIEFGVLPSDSSTSSAPIYFVKDDGAGFDMAYSHKLFGVFQRLHSVSEFPGTGIGLASVRRAIHRHGGQVWIEAAVEQGTTVFFTIPMLP